MKRIILILFALIGIVQSQTYHEVTMEECMVFFQDTLTKNVDYAFNMTSSTFYGINSNTIKLRDAYSDNNFDIRRIVNFATANGMLDTLRVWNGACGVSSISNALVDVCVQCDSVVGVIDTTFLSGNDLLIVQGSDTSNADLSSLSGGSYQGVTKAALDALISSNSLSGNYLVTGVDTGLYGGTSIYVSSLNDSTISSSGYGIFYNPKYDQSINGFGIWDTSNTYSIGDTAIWGGKHWINQNGNVGDSTDLFTLDAEWAFIPFDNISYNVAIDEIKYDYENDLIVYRNEKNSNIVSTSKENIDYFISSIGYSPIKVFQWGNIYNGTKGIGFQNISNSYNENINFKGSYQTYFEFTNISYQNNLTFDNSSQSNLIFDNNSYQSNLTFDNSSQSNLIFDNSFQSNLIFEVASQFNLTFDNSSQSNLTFDNSSQSNLIFDNSFQSNLTFDNSSQSNLIFEVASQFNLTSILGFDQQRIRVANKNIDRGGVPVIATEQDQYFTNYITQP